MMIKTIYSAALVALLGSASMAQHEKPHGKPVGDKPSADKPAADKPAPRADPMKQGAVPFMTYKASDVLGTKVRGQSGEIGKVEDLIVDPTTGRIEYAVLSLTGDRAKGDQWHAVPFGLVTVPPNSAGSVDQPAYAKPDFMLTMDSARLQGAPGFPKDKWADFNAPAWRTENDKFYGDTRSDDMPRGHMPRNGDTIGAHRSYRASELMGKNLQTTSNDEVGEIKELAIDARGARIPYVVISSGGFLGIGDKLHAIPWEAIQVKSDGGKDGDKLIVNLAKDRVLKAPEFKNDDWARMTSPAWNAELYGYYGFKPYWSNTAEAGFRDDKPRDGAPHDEKHKRPTPDGKDPH